MAAPKEEEEEDDMKNVDILPNELSHSVDDPSQSEALNLTIRLQNDLGRKCYVDPHEAFPQATYYLDSSLKRPNYYLKKEQKFNKKVLLPHQANDNLISPSKSSHLTPNNQPSKRKKKRNKNKNNNNNDASNSKMEVDSESDDDDEFESEEEDIDDDNVFDADDELFSASEVNQNNLSKESVNKKDDNFLSVFPKRNKGKIDDDQKSESYELDNDKIKKLKAGQRGFSIDDPDVIIDKSLSEKKRKKFGAWDGVFVSCLLNIFGVIMFLRLGFVVGQAGLWYTFLIILLSCVVTTLTTLSMAAIATNGEQRAG